MSDLVTSHHSRMGGSPPILKAVNITKRFGHVQALSNVCLELVPGEIVGLVGDNGAGKSTLVKCLSGVYQPDSGSIELNQCKVVLHSPMDARGEGIETVYQDLSLANELTVASNVFLGREIYRQGLAGRLGFLDFPKMRKEAETFIKEIGIKLPTVDVQTELLSGGQRQGVAIARARRLGLQGPASEMSPQPPWGCVRPELFWILSAPVPSRAWRLWSFRMTCPPY